MLSTLTDQSLLSVVVNSAVSGLGRQSIRLSVLQYIKDNNTSEFTDLVFADRQERFATTFGREYLPVSRETTPAERNEPREIADLAVLDNDRTISDLAKETYDLEIVSASPMSDRSDDYDDYYEGDLDDSDDMLVPPLPPRLPPREMDPDKLYGLYDFSGPDPLHCTLARDEPVYLVNDLDNYWWLIRKLTKAQRAELWNTPEDEEIESEIEDGKVGFVPAECLETYGERLARLNCFKNEELEKTSKDTLPLDPESEGNTIKQSDTQEELHEETSTPLARSGSILKKSRNIKQHNKLVTFESIGNIDVEGDYSDEVDFTDHYFTHDDINDDHESHPRDDERHSEVLSDVYPTETPLLISKASRKSQNPYLFTKPKFPDDEGSIGSYSPDTPPARFASSFADDESSSLRRSLILDRLSRVTSDIQQELDDNYDSPDDFGGTLDEDFELDEDKDDDTVTPLTSVNSFSIAPTPHKAPEKRKPRPMHDMFMPILGKLDELTEKLAELEHLL